MGTKQSTTPAKLPTAATVTLRQIAPELAEAHALTRKQAEVVLASLVETVTAHLRAGDKVRLTGLGILQVRDRPARTGYRPGDRDQGQSQDCLQGGQGAQGRSLIASRWR